MTKGMQLTQEEYRLIEPELEKIALTSGTTFSIDSLIVRWQDFVCSVERGFDDSIYEYLNDLSSRDLLEQICEAAPAAVRGKIEIALAPIDDAFEAATEPLNKPISPSAEPVPFWRMRVPRKRIGDFKQDLDNEI